jgi:hypothetical protein
MKVRKRSLNFFAVFFGAILFLIASYSSAGPVFFAQNYNGPILDNALQAGNGATTGYTLGSINTKAPKTLMLFAVSFKSGTGTATVSGGPNAWSLVATNRQVTGATHTLQVFASFATTPQTGMSLTLGLPSSVKSSVIFASFTGVDDSSLPMSAINSFATPYGLSMDPVLSLPAPSAKRTYVISFLSNNNGLMPTVTAGAVRKMSAISTGNPATSNIVTTLALTPQLTYQTATTHSYTLGSSEWAGLILSLR